MGDHVAQAGRREASPHAERTSLTLPAENPSVPRARHFVDRALPGMCWADEVSLLVSELASNAVRHARTPFTVSLQCDGSVVRVEVDDDGPGVPVVQNPPSHAVTGRGLVIVDAIADRWGVEASPVGKVVWFELACRSTTDDSG
jgi:signal transduction histidine kinase